jgi:hypothetical protein
MPARFTRRRPNARLRLELLETRANPVVGQFGLPPTVAAGTGYDGVVFLETALPDGSAADCTGALLSDGRHVLTAAHCVDMDGNGVADGPVTVRFDLPGKSIIQTVDPSAISIAPGWQGENNIGNGHDLAILLLPSLAPSGPPGLGADRYPVWQSSFGSELNQPYTIIGYGVSGTGFAGQIDGTQGTKRIGHNLYEVTSDPFSFTGDPGTPVQSLPGGGGLVSDFDDGSKENDALGRVFGLHQLGLIDEVSAAQGDSGGPSLISVNGQNYIVGVVSLEAGGTLPPNPVINPRLAAFGDLSVDTRVAAYSDFIDSATHGMCVLRLDLNTQVVGNDGKPDSVEIHQVGDVVQVFVDGNLYFSDHLANVCGIQIIGSKDPTTLLIGAEVSGDLFIHAQGTNGQTDERPVVTATAGAQLLLAGADAGGSPVVAVRDLKTGAPLEQFYAYDPSFRGGVRVATGDVNGDGFPDIITAAGPGGGPHVKVFDGVTGGLIRQFFAYDAAFTGGVNVTAGDIDGDGNADIVTGADAGGGPHVKAFSGTTGKTIASFYAYDPSIHAGVRVAVGDVNGDGTNEVITAPGPGWYPEVKVFDPKKASAGATPPPGSATVAFRILNDNQPGQLASFMAYDPLFLGGVYIATGDFNRDLRSEIVTGAGAGGGPHVKVFDGQSLQVFQSFFALDPSFGGGVRVSARDLNGDGHADVVVGTGPGVPALVEGFEGQTLQPLTAFDPFGPAFLGGVFVA